METVLFGKKIAGHPVQIIDRSLVPGDAYIVDSGASGASDTAGHGKTAEKPFATIDFAIGQCTDSNGDVIFVLPGHTETVTAAAGIDADVKGITIIGLGNGNDRPTISVTTATTADIDIGAAEVTFQNLIFDLTGKDALVAPLDVNSAGFTMKNCRIIMSDSQGQAVLGVLCDGNADRVLIEDCQFVGSSDTGPAAAVRFLGLDEGTIRRCTFTGDYSVGNISFLTTAATNVLIEDCDFNNLNAVDVNVEGIASATGTLRRNTCRIATNGQTTWLNTLGGLQLYENYGVNNDAEAGGLIGTVST